MKMFFMASVLFGASLCHTDQKCTGVIDEVIVSRQGHVSIVSSEIYSDPEYGRRICYLENVPQSPSNPNITVDSNGTWYWKAVSQKTCEAWYAKALAAMYSRSAVMFVYDEDTACSSIPTWEAAPSPRAIRD